MRTLAWIARHGSTTDSDKGIFRGQRDSALDKKGFTDAHQLHDFFEEHPWKSIFTSPLTRSIQTAIVIAGEKDDEIMPAIPELKPWNIGYLTGKPKKEYSDDMQYFIDNPGEVIQDGESRDQFEHNRVHPLLIELIEVGLKGEPPILIGHSSIIHALNHLLIGEAGDIAVKPGGVVEIFED